MTSLPSQHQLPIWALLTRRQAASALACSERTLWSITSPRGPLPAVKIGRRGVRYSVADLQAWIEQQKGNGGAK